MLFLTDFLDVIRLAFNPQKRTNAHITKTKIFGLYCKALIIPLIVYYLLAYPSLVAAGLSDLELLGALCALLAYGLILFPLLLISLAGIFYIGARLLKYASVTMHGAFTSVFYSGSVAALFFTLVYIVDFVVTVIMPSAVPISTGVTNVVFELLTIAIAAWALVILVISFSQQNKISRIKTISTIIVGVIAVSVIVFVIVNTNLFNTFNLS